MTEDLTGYPFVGRAGKLLDKWIKESMDFHFIRANMPPFIATKEKQVADDSYFSYAITNLVLCRPCDGPAKPNRAPTGVEVANCYTRLREFVKIANPRALVLVGRPATVHAPRWDVPTLEIVHPSHILRRYGEGSKEDQKERDKLCQFLKTNQQHFSKEHKNPSGTSGSTV